METLSNTLKKGRKSMRPVQQHEGLSPLYGIVPPPHHLPHLRIRLSPPSHTRCSSIPCSLCSLLQLLKPCPQVPSIPSIHHLTLPLDS